MLEHANATKSPFAFRGPSRHVAGQWFVPSLTDNMRRSWKMVCDSNGYRSIGSAVAPSNWRSGIQSGGFTSVSKPDTVLPVYSKYKHSACKRPFARPSLYIYACQVEDNFKSAPSSVYHPVPYHNLQRHTTHSIKYVTCHLQA